MISSALLMVALLAVPEPIRLTPGGQEVLRIPGLTRIALSKEEIADVRVLNNGELLLLGKQKGRTTLTLWVHGRVSSRAVVVDDGRSSEIARMVHEAVSPGLKVDEYNGRVVIDGVVDSVEDLERLKRLVGADPNVTMLVTLNPRVLPVVAQMITTQLHREGLKTARAVCVGGKIFLEGSVSDRSESNKAQLIADAIYARASGGR